MENANGPIIDMTRSGDFIDAPKPGLGAIVTRVAVFGALLLVAAVAFWAALFIVPVLLLLGVVGFFVVRQQIKRSQFVVMRQ